MILGLPGPAECFRELDDALAALGRPDVILGAHDKPAAVPEGATVYNLENVGVQVSPDAFPGCRVWDFSLRNCDMWLSNGRDVEYVPIGYHSSMERFAREENTPYDVIFTGCTNERRLSVLRDLSLRGLNVVLLHPGIYGEARNKMLARAKVALNMRFYPDGMYPSLRAAHLVANKVPMLSEWAPEMPEWAGVGVTYDSLVDACYEMVTSSPEDRRFGAEQRYESFKRQPMVVPC